MLKRYRGVLGLVILLFAPALACGFGGDDGPPRNAAVVQVTANTSLMPWLEETVAAFNRDELETDGGRQVYVQLAGADAGQAVINIQNGARVDLWLPDQQVWTNVLAREGNDAFQNNCTSVAQSPLIIAMWRPAAEALGWPGRDLGWLDIGSLAADPGSWDYYSGGQFGDVLRLGHTHPGLSASGANTLLAIVQAAELKTTPVEVADIEQPIVQASVGAFEGAVSWFSSNTGALAQTMRERGVQFLGAAVVYESDVVQYGEGDLQIVPIYPFEGTFMAEHPACVNTGSAAEAREGAQIFREYLLGEAAQLAAAENGLRPVSDTAGVADTLAALELSHGLDLAQPEIVFGAPSTNAIYAVQELWQSARKNVNLVMVIDVSGSMSGAKIDSVRRSAVQFIEQMAEDDYLSIISFSSQPQSLIKYQRVGDHRETMIDTVLGLQAQGDTSLYDAIADGANLIRNTETPETSSALVLLTDGLDTSSFRHTQDSAAQTLAETGATVFTIAFGNDADEDLLERIALQANGNFFLGDEASIAAIYDEMSAAFGGIVGVGR